MSGKKFDEGKNPLDLLPIPALWAVGRVLEHGKAKYDSYNWAGGMRWSRLFGAALRHLFKFWAGCDRDKESGLLHLSHASCCLLFLLTYQLRRWGEDDRYRGYSEGGAAPADGGADGGSKAAVPEDTGAKADWGGVAEVLNPGAVMSYEDAKKFLKG